MPIGTLELRPLAETLEACDLRCPFLARQPLSSGDYVDMWRNGRWLTGRFEWWPLPEANATVHSSEGVFLVKPTTILRRI